MKKISLKNVKQALKRDEMRAITGGSGGYWCWSDSNCRAIHDHRWMCVGGFCKQHN